MVAHRHPRQEEVEPADERVEAEVPPGQRLVVVEQGGVGVGEPASQRPGIARGEPTEAERRASSRATGKSPTAMGRRCSADSTSGRPKPSHDDGSTTTSHAA